MRSGLAYFAAPLLGAIAVGGFHPFEYWFFPLISISAVLFMAQKRVFRDRVIIFYLYGIGFLGPLLHWSSTYVGAVPWIILTLGFSVFFILLAFGYSEGHLLPVAAASAFAVGEGLRAIVPFGGFGWGRVGFSQLEGPFQMWLRIGGVSLTGFMVALIAALLATKDRRSFLIVPIILAGILIINPATAAQDPFDDQETLRIGLIQGGVSQLGLAFNATPQEVFDRHIAVTEDLLKREQVDLVLWPENASDIDPLVNESLNTRLNEIAKRSGAPLVIGAVTESGSGPENVSLMFDGSGEEISRYQKRDLVPFGEYIPLRSIASRISSLTDSVRDFVPGNEIVSHSVGGIHFAPLICYEILDDRVAYDNLERSNLGVVQTNNATFGRSWQSGQQFQITRVRAYESRIRFVVAATTGDTAMIDPNGETLEKLTKYDPGSMVVEVSPSKASIPPIGPEVFLLAAMILFFFSRIKLNSVITKVKGWVR
ncbi:MAG: apolipoprotein N-acyltransferase [Candidatus Nanopelagicaceae bacterium]